ncbi:MAG: hypothetical protein JSR79_11295 [Proteobacteria bacterium]|nr:hypothetical protein [Pseudomonadota bacterium]
MQVALDQIPANVQDAIDRIPPEAWPLIDTTARITVVVALVWIFLALVAWWRRRAYNLTVASTAKRNKAAEPDFLHVDKEAREAAVERGKAHETELTERERLEALAASSGLSKGSHFARLAALLMSLFTLACSIMGVVGNVGAMEKSVQNLTASGKIQYIVTQHPIATVIIVLVIAYNVWHYFQHRKWEEA